MVTSVFGFILVCIIKRCSKFGILLILVQAIILSCLMVKLIYSNELERATDLVCDPDSTVVPHNCDTTLY